MTAQKNAFESNPEALKTSKKLSGVKQATKGCPLTLITLLARITVCPTNTELFFVLDLSSIRSLMGYHFRVPFPVKYVWILSAVKIVLFTFETVNTKECGRDTMSDETPVQNESFQYKRIKPCHVWSKRNQFKTS